MCWYAYLWIFQYLFSNEDKRREALQRKHNFEQFKKSKHGLSDLVDIGLVLASLTAAYFLIIGILS